MSWLKSHECDLRTTGEFPIDPWLGASRDTHRLLERVHPLNSKPRIRRVLGDVPDLARLISAVVDFAAERGLRSQARLSWVDETPNQLLLEIPAAPESASGFLDALDDWMISNFPADVHSRLIVDVCFPA